MKNIFYKQREDFLKTLPERDKKFTFPDDVEEIKNVPYASDGLPAHRLDIYRPRKAGGQKLPVIVNVHGGGLIIGCKEFNRYFCANLCKKGYLVFSVEYRLVPDCLFFDQCRDVFAAMDFIGEHLAEYSGLPDRIFAVGDSGGACLPADLLSGHAEFPDGSKSCRGNVFPGLRSVRCGFRPVIPSCKGGRLHQRHVLYHPIR